MTLKMKVRLDVILLRPRDVIWLLHDFKFIQIMHIKKYQTAFFQIPFPSILFDYINNNMHKPISKENGTS